MKRKFFAALASASMLLSTGTCVFAQDFEEDQVLPSSVDEEVDLETSSAAKVNMERTFTDDIVYDAVVTALAANGVTPDDEDEVSKSALADIKSIDVSGAASLSGIRYLIGLRSFSCEGGEFDEVNLSAMKYLQNVVLKDNEALTSVILPRVDTITDLTITENPALTSLNLSSLKGLVNADLSSNDLGDLNVSSDPLLEKLNVAYNDLNTLDVSKNGALKTLECQENGLYELKVPASVVTVHAQNNKLKNFNASKLENLNELDLSDNMLSSVRVYKKNYSNLDLSRNHLASLNLKEVTGVISVDEQVLYANTDAKAVDLEAYDENFRTNRVVKEDKEMAVYGGTIEDGVFSFANNAKSHSYDYNTQSDGITMTVSILKADLMNRLYNPNSGEHFYTKDQHEKDVLVKLGWKYEGIGWSAPVEGAPVYRLYNPNAGDHHYTMSSNEKDTLVSIGWQYEGIGWYSVSKVTAPAYGALQVYREYNPNAKAAGSHNYTVSEIENDDLADKGWIEEGIAWWALK